MADQTIGAPTFTAPYSELTANTSQSGGEDVLQAAKSISLIADTIAKVSGDRKVDALEESLNTLGEAAVHGATLAGEADPLLTNIEDLSEEEQQMHSDIATLVQRSRDTTGSMSTMLALQAKRKVHAAMASTGNPQLQQRLHATYNTFLNTHPSVSQLALLQAARADELTRANAQLQTIYDKSYTDVHKGGYGISETTVFLSPEWSAAFFPAQQRDEEIRSILLQEQLKEGNNPKVLSDKIDGLIKLFTPEMLAGNDGTNPTEGPAGTYHQLLYVGSQLFAFQKEATLKGELPQDQQQMYTSLFTEYQQQVDQFFQQIEVDRQHYVSKMNSLNTGSMAPLAQLKLQSLSDLEANLAVLRAPLDAATSEDMEPANFFKGIVEIGRSQFLAGNPNLTVAKEIFDSYSDVLQMDDLKLTFGLQQQLVEMFGDEISILFDQIDWKNATLQTISDANAKADQELELSVKGDNLPDLMKSFAVATSLESMFRVDEMNPVQLEANVQYPQRVADMTAERARLLYEMSLKNVAGAQLSDGVPARQMIENSLSNPQMRAQVYTYYGKDAGRTNAHEKAYTQLGHAIDTYLRKNGNYANRMNGLMAYSRNEWAGVPFVDLVDISIDSMDEDGRLDSDIISVKVRDDVIRQFQEADIEVVTGDIGGPTGHTMTDTPYLGYGVAYQNILPEEEALDVYTDRATGLPTAPSRLSRQTTSPSALGISVGRVMGTEHRPQLAEGDYSILLERLETAARAYEEELIRIIGVNNMREMLQTKRPSDLSDTVMNDTQLKTLLTDPTRTSMSE